MTYSPLTKRGEEEVTPEQCQQKAGEYLRQAIEAKREREAQALRHIAHSWTRLAGQIDRLTELQRAKETT